MKNIKEWIYLVMLGIVITACTDNYKDWNTNPNEVPEDKLVGLMKIGNFFPAIEADIIPTSDETANEYQRAQNLCGDMHSGYVAPIGTWGYSSACHYNLTYDKWNDVAFQVAFTKVMPAWKQIRDNSKNEFPEVFAVAEVLKIAAMHRITDIYGPLPYLKFGHGGVETPYNSQEEIYASFIVDLDNAITTLKDYIIKHPNSKPLQKYDLVYNGRMDQWLKFANSLKLRLAIRMVYTDYNINGKTPQILAEEAVRDGVIESNSDNAYLKSGNGISVFNPWDRCWNMYGDVRMSANMESFLMGYSDPRISKYFQLSEYGDYHGARLGNYVYSKTNYLKLSSPNISAESPIQWMCAAELYFLRAEGAIRGWNMNGEAQNFYEKGIQISFEQWGASIGSYLTDDTSTPASFTPKTGSGSIPQGSPNLSTITIKWNSADNFELKLERIMTQKWLAMYPEGQEAWTEYRRTGYPKLFPVLYNKSGNTVDNSGPRRIPYPSTEYDTNTEEVTKAVNSFLGGNDYGNIKLWWDKKN